VRVAQRLDLGRAGMEIGHAGLILGDGDLAAHFEAAIITDQRLDLVPHPHGGDRQRDLRCGTQQPAHAAGIDARGVPAGGVLLDQDDLEAAPGDLQGARAALDAAADDQHIGSHAHSAASMAASSPSVTGFKGGRMR